jgi:serine kinase of HPr protein (carbohydrate metabolism regulator)
MSIHASSIITNIHATSIMMQGYAVLLMGKSGAGKSDLALRLIDRGAVLISDDYTDLRVTGAQLIAHTIPNIAGKLELRGVGIIPLAYIESAPVALLLQLGAPVERMPQAHTHTLCGISLPCYALAPFEASAPLKVETLLQRTLMVTLADTSRWP